ncbi:hypothetical protein GL4_3065 [Methyloceanibacter caenitepidi]|uniref:Uncharacterized protein n=1 Tax=Methyloceanibacter caenitepidi TaxID=1384459 RepID=A0A0A8K7H8_9HYPH|nr:hypothetical protein GL4_3065 [Methyloceanibacter caenitepidi]
MWPGVSCRTASGARARPLDRRSRRSNSWGLRRNDHPISRD